MKEHTYGEYILGTFLHLSDLEDRGADRILTDRLWVTFRQHIPAKATTGEPCRTCAEAWPCKPFLEVAAS